MSELDQTRAPLYEALLEMKDNRLVPFDVPGHKRGRGNPELAEFLGKDCLDVDVNSMKPLDNLCHPVSVIGKAQKLAADAFGAGNAFFMVNGTTSAVQAMILYACKEGEKIIMPRNVHRSAINALIVSGAIPVYVDPGIDANLGIPLGMSVKSALKAMDENPDAKAVLVNNPTYYGVCSDLRSIVSLAHERGMLALADEAHGTHFYFSSLCPPSAMECGADLSAASMHKSGGSLTQSSILLCASGIDEGRMRQIINLTQTTSPSYLLMSSLDLSRRNLALRGEETFKRVIEYARYARGEINKIGDYYAFSKELINGSDVFDFDETKLSVHTLGTGISGMEVYDILRDEYDIQTEFGDISNILAYISVGDRQRDIERLISALADIRRNYKRPKYGLPSREYIPPEVEVSPREAFYSETQRLPLRDAVGRISAEFAMCYPPGIPILAPGERVTEQIVDYIEYAKSKGGSMTGASDIETKTLKVLKG